MVNEVLAFLRCPILGDKSSEDYEPNAVFIDATLGTAGHTLAMLEAHPTCRVVAFDRDADSMEVAKGRLEEAGVASRVTLVQGDFRFAPQLLQPFFDNQKVGTDGRPIQQINGALIDAGMSLFQVTSPERGLSFRADGPLDMRYNRATGPSAFDLVNQLSQNELEDLFFKFADERWARRIAQFITAHRRTNPITTTGQLASIVESAIPAGVRHQSRVHPATKTFAALRLAVNDEFWALDHGAWALSSLLAPAARLVVLTYSSNEDRTIKRTFRRLAERDIPTSLDNQPRKKRKTEASSGKPRPSGPARPSLTFSLKMPGEDAERDSQIAAQFPGLGTTWKMKIVTKKPVEPSPEEIASNPLSRSCKLRAVEKCLL